MPDTKNIPLGLQAFYSKQDDYVDVDQFDMQHQKFRKNQFHVDENGMLTARVIEDEIPSAVMPENPKLIGKIKGNYYGRYRFKEEKKEGVEVGYNAVRGWVNKDSQKISEPLFAIEEEFSENAFGELKEGDPRIARAVKVGNKFVIPALDENGNFVLATRLPPYTNKLNKHRLLAIQYAASKMHQPVDDVLLFKIDRQLNQIFHFEQHAKSKKEIREKDLIANPELGITSLDLELMQHVQNNMAKFNLFLRRKMNNELNIFGTVNLPFKKTKGGSATKFLHYFSRFSTVEQSNIDAIMECLANDMHKVFFPHQTQDLFVVPSLHQDGRLRFFLDGKNTQRKEQLIFGEEPGEKFSDAKLEKGERYDVVKNVMSAGYYVGENPEQIDDKALTSHFRNQGMYGAIFYLFGDRDALGSKGNNKLFNKKTNDLMMIDPGKSLSSSRLLDHFDFSDDFTLTPPQDYVTKMKGGYKNFRMFEDAPIDEKMLGILIMAKMRGVSLKPDVLASYTIGAEKNGMSQIIPMSDYLKDFSHESDIAVFIQYATQFATNKEITNYCRDRLLKNEKIFIEPMEADENRLIKIRFMEACIIQGGKHLSGDKKIQYETYVKMRFEKGAIAGLNIDVSQQAKFLTLLRQSADIVASGHNKFYDKTIVHIGKRKAQYVARREKMLDVFINSGRLELKKEELLLLDNIEKLMSKTTHEFSHSGETVILQHLKKLERVPLQMKKNKDGEWCIQLPADKKQLLDDFLHKKSNIPCSYVYQTGGLFSKPSLTVNFDAAKTKEVLQFFSEAAISEFKNQPLAAAQKITMSKDALVKQVLQTPPPSPLSSARNAVASSTSVDASPLSLPGPSNLPFKKH